MAKFEFETEIADKLTSEQVIINQNTARKREVNEETKGEIENAKVTQYAHFMCGVKDAPRKLGKLSRSNRKKIAETLANAECPIDISKGRGKRLYDASVALTNPAIYKKTFGEDMPSQPTPTYFKSLLLNNDLSTERAIQKAALDKEEKGDDDIDAVVRQFVGGFTYSKDEDGSRKRNNWRTGGKREKAEELLVALHRAMKIDEAVAAKAEEVGKNNIDIDEIVDQIDL